MFNRLKKYSLVSIVVMLFLTTTSFSKDRCQDFIPDVRQASIQYLGFGFPYWYNIGCMIAESNCRPNIVSFDGGIGLFQLTPSTGVTAELSKFIFVDPYNVQSNIRAQAFYIHRIMNVHFKREKATIRNKYVSHPSEFVKNCGLNLADVYRFYNGGYWSFYESELGNWDCKNRDIFEHCIRGGTWVGTGSKRRWLSFCEVNYSYPEKIFKHSKPYKSGSDGTFNFW